MKKPITTQGTFCDAPGCEKQVVERGRRHIETPAAFSIGIYRPNGDRISVNLAEGLGDCCSFGCFVDAIKKTYDKARAEDEKLPFKDDTK
jgi:hypothetical protein